MTLVSRVRGRHVSRAETMSHRAPVRTAQQGWTRSVPLVNHLHGHRLVRIEHAETDLQGTHGNRAHAQETQRLPQREAVLICVNLRRAAWSHTNGDIRMGASLTLGSRLIRVAVLASALGISGAPTSAYAITDQEAQEIG